mmetsp:Transcript_6360/g.17085  ORF Transcript_6360/g.17085 Transcript_6360/m.17085 type:complete len:948 (-) Transcript_6360:43-2886(-)
MVRYDAESEGRTPWISILCVTGAIACQTFVLAGNLHTVNNLKKLGYSSSGWAHTGMNLADSFGDFSVDLFGMSATMANVIDDVLLIEEALDTLILDIGSNMGSTAINWRDLVSVPRVSPDTDSLIQVGLSVFNGAIRPDDAPSEDLQGRLPQMPSLSAIASDVRGPCDEVLRKAEPALRDIRPKMRALVQRLAPALKQIHRWLSDLSQKVQSYVGHFGVTMGRVQEIFDVVTDSFTTALTSDQEMIDQTYTLFDTSNTGLISRWDLGNVSHMFGITVLQGDRVDSLFELYDSNDDQLLDKDEFGSMMLDPSTPGIMATVLRAYADRLSEVAGPLKRAETRGEVAAAVASYLQTVAAKNMTKVGWMSQALTNGTLPINFTVAVLNHLALASEDPSRMTTVDPGVIIVKHMVVLNTTAVRRMLELMVDPDAWAAEGLDPELQPAVIERVAKWAVAGGITNGVAVCAALVGTAHIEDADQADGSFSGRVEQLDKEMQALPELYRWRAERGHRSYVQARQARSARTMDRMMGSEKSRQLLEGLLGSVLPPSTQTSPQATRAVHKGRRAAPEVLQFAQWLANNASRTSAALMTRSFDYSTHMSHHVQGLASKIRAVAEKVYSALQFLSRYASDGAVDELMAAFDNFEKLAPQELLDLCNRMAGGDEALADRRRLAQNSSWSRVSRIMRQVESLFPAVIESMEVAQENVAGTSLALSNIMEMMTIKLPDSFSLSARWWKAFWVTYYILFLIVDIVMISWILWVAGMMRSRTEEEGGEKKPGEEEYETYQPPRTMGERLKVCLAGCNACLESRLVDRTMLFWSVLLLVELCVFVSFIFTLLLSMLAMVKLFIHSGCNQLYMLGDGVICAEIMVNIKMWLTTFLNRDFLTPLTVCDKRMLLTCNLISNDLLTSSVFTVVGGFIGSFLTFQVIVESAICHERIRWHRAMSAPRTEL